jgi:hypothetical protein
MYLYDILLLNASKERVLEDLVVTFKSFQKLGFLILWNKFVLIPSQGWNIWA